MGLRAFDTKVTGTRDAISVPADADVELHRTEIANSERGIFVRDRNEVLAKLGLPADASAAEVLEFLMAVQAAAPRSIAETEAVVAKSSLAKRLSTWGIETVNLAASTYTIWQSGAIQRLVELLSR